MENYQDDFERPSDFDWMETLAAAGIESKPRDLSHMKRSDMIALLVAEEQAAIDLARLVGLPQECDTSDQPIPVTMTDEGRTDLLAKINAAPIAMNHLAAVLRVVALIPPPIRYAGPAPAYSVIEYVENHDFGTPDVRQALLARVIALSRWRDAHEHTSEAPKSALIDAACQAPVIFSEGLPAFEEPAFAALVDFIVDLPW